MAQAPPFSLPVGHPNNGGNGSTKAAPNDNLASFEGSRLLFLVRLYPFCSFPWALSSALPTRAWLPQASASPHTPQPCCTRTSQHGTTLTTPHVGSHLQRSLQGSEADVGDDLGCHWGPTPREAPDPRDRKEGGQLGQGKKVLEMECKVETGVPQDTDPRA